MTILCYYITISTNTNHVDCSLFSFHYTSITGEYCCRGARVLAGIDRVNNTPALHSDQSVAWMIEYCIPRTEYIKWHNVSLPDEICRCVYCVMWGRTMGDTGDMSHHVTMTSCHPWVTAESDLSSLARFIRWLGLVNAGLRSHSRHWY